MEMLNSRYRSFTGVNIQMQFAVGYILLGALNAIPMLLYWRYFSAAICIFGAIAVICAFSMPGTVYIVYVIHSCHITYSESPAWLFSKGRTDEALLICEDILERKTGSASFPQDILESGTRMTHSMT